MTCFTWGAGGGGGSKTPAAAPAPSTAFASCSANATRRWAFLPGAGCAGSSFSESDPATTRSAAGFRPARIRRSAALLPFATAMPAVPPAALPAALRVAARVVLRSSGPIVPCLARFLPVLPSSSSSLLDSCSELDEDEWPDDPDTESAARRFFSARVPGCEEGLTAGSTAPVGIMLCAGTSSAQPPPLEARRPAARRHDLRAVAGAGTAPAMAAGNMPSAAGVLGAPTWMVSRPSAAGSNAAGSAAQEGQLNGMRD